MKPYVSAADRLRSRGLCPHDQTPCAHARTCSLRKMDACLLLCNNLAATCTRCRAARGACRFECFRERT